jgi:hypothetical protein
LIAGAIIATQGEKGHARELNSLGMGIIGVGLLGFAFSFIWWNDEWAEFNRRPRAWVVKYFEEFAPPFSFSSPDWIDYHRRMALLMGFGALWLGGGFTIGALLLAAGIGQR